MGGIAKLLGLDTKKWNEVAERLTVIEDVMLPLVEEVRSLVAEFKEIADIILDRKETP